MSEYEVNGPTSPCFVSTTLAIVIFVLVALCITNLCHRDAKKLFMSAKAAGAKSNRWDSGGKRQTSDVVAGENKMMMPLKKRTHSLVYCSLTCFDNIWRLNCNCTNLNKSSNTNSLFFHKIILYTKKFKIFSRWSSSLLRFSSSLLLNSLFSASWPLTELTLPLNFNSVARIYCSCWERDSRLAANVIMICK